MGGVGLFLEYCKYVRHDFTSNKAIKEAVACLNSKTLTYKPALGTTCIRAY